MAASVNKSNACHCHESRNSSIDPGSKPPPIERSHKESSSCHKQSLSSSSNRTRSFQASSSITSKDLFRNLTREILNSELFQRSDSKIVESEEAEPVKFNPMSVTSLEVPIMLSEEYVFLDLICLHEPELTRE